MSFSMQSRHRICLADEISLGQMAAPANVRRMRFSGTELGFRRKVIESDEIREDRQIAALIPSLGMVEGDIDVELAFGAYDDLLAASLCGSWSADVLKMGNVETSFTIERGFTDIEEFQVFSGCMVDEFHLSIQPESLISGRFSLIGQEMSHGSSPLDLAPAESPFIPPMDSFQGEILEGGSVLAHVTGLDLSIKNNVERAYSIGSDMASDLLPGTGRISGHLSAYFESDSLIQKVLNKTESSLEIRLQGTGGAYHILLPRVIYTGADIPVKGERAVMIKLPFTAIRDEGEGTSLKMTRIAD